MTQAKQPEEIELTLQDPEDVLADVDIYLAYGMHDEAISALERAIRNGRDRPEYRVRLVEAYALAGDDNAVHETAKIARAQLDTGEHALLERIAEAEARFPGLEQAPGQPGRPAVAAPAGAADSNAPADAPSFEPEGQEGPIEIPADGDRGAGRAENIEGTVAEPNQDAAPRDAKPGASTPAHWLRLSPRWIAALFVASSISLVVAVLSLSNSLDSVQEPDRAIGEAADSALAEPRDSLYSEGTEQHARPDEAALSVPAGTTLIVGEVSFNAGGTAVDAAFDPLLGDIAGTLAHHTDSYAEVVGHAERTGTIEYSELLARQRAQAVTNRLISLGTASHRIRVKVQETGEPVREMSSPDEASTVKITVRTPTSAQ